MNLISEDYLMHYGVKGMKWGVRKDPQRSQRKREYKLNTYKDRLSNKATKKAASNRKKARKFGAEYRDLESNGMRSKSWNDEVEARAERYIDQYGIVAGSLSTLIEGNSKSEFNKYKSQVKYNMNRYYSKGRKWSQRNKNLMNMPISEFTTKKDIKKVYKGK